MRLVAASIALLALSIVVAAVIVTHHDFSSSSYDYSNCDSYGFGDTSCSP